jgi:flagellin
MTALQTLTQINKDLGQTQARISTGLRVSKASDNAAYWSIASGMRSDNAALSAVQEALGLGAAKVDTAYAGMDSAIEVVKEIKNKLITAQEPSADREKIQADITQLQQQLRGIAESASFSGENWLQADLSGGAVTKSVVSSFVRDSAGNISVQRIDYSLDGTTVLFDTIGNTGILDTTTAIEGASVTLNVNVAGVVSAYTVQSFTTDDVIAAGAGATTFDGSYANDGTLDYVKVADDTWVLAVDQTTVPDQEVQYEDSATNLWAIDLTATPTPSTTSSVDALTISSATTIAQLSGMLTMVEDAMTMMMTSASALGSISSRIELQNEFISKLTDSLDRGIGRLVDADMEEESARLSALQVQQQLGIQALSIANSNAQNILSLFQG